ncbi:MAG: glycosyl hydrolase [Treponema sp.]|nr:MAG: glycosyl hydrolase [Treponema sp.]
MLKLKEGFKLGVATASTQIEGGRVGSNWNDFSDRGMISDGSNAARANMHYEKFQEDTKLLQSLGIEVYRFSVEWARLEPRENEFDNTAFKHYRKELLLLKEAGITPLMTLYHFSHPMWFEKKGAFTKKDNIPIFLRFVEKCITELGDLCDDYITINEPNVYAVQSYFFGLWPPEKKSLTATLKVMSIFVACHCLAYNAIHKIKLSQGAKKTRVSFAHHMQAFHPKKQTSFFDKLGVKFFKHFFQDALMHACFNGEFKFPIKNYCKLEKKQYADFIAINYYSRQAVNGFSYSAFENTIRNDLDWEIYPEGIIECAKECYACRPMPIIISENGTCDNQDSFRSKYIFEHLKKISDSELPFEAYCHWCFIDNFEWKEGESARFGIVHCNYETQERKIKKSGEFYRELIQKRAVDEAMFKKYIGEYNPPR